MQGRFALPTPVTTCLPFLFAVQALPNMQPGYCVLAQSFEFGGGELAAAALAGPEQGGGSRDRVGGSNNSRGSRGSRDGSDEEMPQAAEGETAPQQHEEGSAGAAGGAAAAAAALEDRLQECLLEAFAAGTGAQSLLVGG